MQAIRKNVPIGVISLMRAIRSTALICSILAIATMAATPTLLWGQTGTLSGTLVDGETGETLIGANVLVTELTQGTTTDLDGRYTISGIPAGDYTVQLSYIGFQTVTVNAVTISAGEVTRIDYILQPEAVGLDEVVVEARAIRNTEANLLRDRQKASAVSDAISAEAISRSGSGDAAAAMTKVTGASVVGGKYVFIRGLGDRYTNTTLNGSSLPSADPDKKAFQLDLFPSSLLESIVTLKTFTPDKPGDFSGGLVDISTKTFPDQFSFQFSASATYEDGVSFTDSFLGYEGGATDWLGYDDGTRGLPEILASKPQEEEMPDEFDLKDVRGGVTNEMRAGRADTLNLYSGAFNDQMYASLRSVPVSYGFSTGVGGQTTFMSLPIGYTGSATYGRSYSMYSDGEYGQWSLIGGTVDDVDNLTPNTTFTSVPRGELLSRADSLEFGNYKNQSASDEASWGLSGTIAVRPSPRHEIALTALTSQSGKSQATVLGGFRDQAPQVTFATQSLSYQERSLRSYQLRGKHAWTRSNLEWKLSRGANTQYEPDLRFLAYDINVRPVTAGVDTLYSLGGGNAPAPQRYFRDLNESNWEFKADLTIPFEMASGRPASIKTGIATTSVDRTFRQRRFDYYQGRPLRGSEEVNFTSILDGAGGDLSAYFDPNNMGVIDTVNVGTITAFVPGLYLLETSPLFANYDGGRDVMAAYQMIDAPVTNRLRIIAGARFEATNIQNESLDMTLPESQRVGRISKIDVLPSLNTVFELTNTMNVRMAATRTIARPTFRELAPFQSYDFVGGNIKQGNPALDRTTINNYDVRWEWFRNPGEIIAASIFRKEFADPIETVIQTVGEGQYLSYQNVPTATVQGFELEGRLNLGNLTSNALLSGFSVGGNYSRIISTVDIPDEEMVLIQAGNPNASASRELEGQSPYIINANLSYDRPERGLSASIYLNRFGRRLTAVTQGATPDVYENARTEIDAMLSKSISRNVRLRISAKNLLESEVRQTQTFKGTEYTYFGYSRPRTVSFSLAFGIN